MRTINNNWKFKPSYDEKAIKSVMTDYETVHIPHTNKELPYNYINEYDYQFTSTYQTSFDMDKINKHEFLEFEAVGHYAKVYLNGTYLGEHKGGYTSFKFEITDTVKLKDNLLTVIVDSSENLNIPPFGKVIDYLTYGGIYREVNLISKDEYFIEDVYTYGVDVLDKKTVGLDLTVNKLTENLTYNVKYYNNKKIVHELNDLKVTELVNSVVTNITDLKLWDIDNPHLYNVVVELVVNNKVIDTKEIKTGYRKAVFTNKGFFLNGKHLDIIGLNRHQSYPYVGYAMPKSAQVMDAHILKYELGVNLARTSHYPQSKYFLEACDEIGLLVFEEIPGWQNIGDLEWQDIAVENVKEMVLMHRNHPSIINWGVRINESQDNKAFYMRTNAIARLLDPHRQTGGIRNIEMIKPDKEAWLEDVYTYNDFDYREGHALTDTKKVFPVPGIPGIVTEHSGHTFPTKSFDNEERRITHALRHTNIINHMKGKEEISGSIGWCAFDYNTHVEFGSGDRICYHGVMDMFRNTKTASHAYASQGVKKPYLHVSSSMNIGEHDRAVIGDIYLFTNVDEVKMYRNDKLVTTLKPSKDLFPNLDHPPMLIDWFGDVLVDVEKYSLDEANRIKKIHRAINKYGLNGLPLDILNISKGAEELDHILDLHNKHIQNWSGKAIGYKFEGYIDGKLVITKQAGGEFEANLTVKADTNKLKNDTTYDVVRITVEKQSEFGNRLIYANDAFTINTNDKVEVIGEDVVSLIGGVRSFWVKTKPGVSGEAIVTITHQNQDHIINLTVV